MVRTSMSPRSAPYGKDYEAKSQLERSDEQSRIKELCSRAFDETGSTVTIQRNDSR